MALANGVLVHGPQAWACAVRTDDGELKVVARRKRFRAARSRIRCCAARRGSPRRSRCSRRSSARCPRRGSRWNARGLASMIGSALRAAGRQALGASPARARADHERRSRGARRVRAARRGARRVSRRGAHLDRDLRARRRSRPKEHERCGSHLDRPDAADQRREQPRDGAGARALPRRPPAAGAVGAVAASVESSAG